MTTSKEQLSELVSLTQLFLLREFSIQDRIVADPETLIYFRKWVMGSKQPAGTKISTPPPPKQDAISKPDLAPTTSQPSESESIPTPQITPPSTLATSPSTTIQAEVTVIVDVPPIAASLDVHVTTTAPVTPPTTTPTPVSKTLNAARLLQCEPLPAPQPTNSDEFKALFEKHFPQLILKDSPLDDALARKRKEAWKIEQQLPPILLLSFNDQENQLVFLKNIARAISLHLAPACVVSAHKFEQEKSWEEALKTPHMKLIIASDYGLYMLPELMKYYKESAKGAKHALGAVPLLLLSDLSLYIKQPQLKPLLWRAICAEFNQK